MKGKSLRTGFLCVRGVKWAEQSTVSGGGSSPVEMGPGEACAILSRARCSIQQFPRVQQAWKCFGVHPPILLSTYTEALLRVRGDLQVSLLAVGIGRGHDLQAGCLGPPAGQGSLGFPSLSCMTRSSMTRVLLRGSLGPCAQNLCKPAEHPVCLGSQASPCLSCQPCHSTGSHR